MSDETRLAGRIRAEIDAGGPMTFERFMELVLYDPLDGYYATRADRPTRQGDFLTAPELHPIFGHVLSRQLGEMWERLGRPAGFTVREYGAGAGTLMLTVMAGLAVDGSPLHHVLRYEPVEASPRGLAELVERWAAAGLADRIVTDGPAGLGPRGEPPASGGFGRLTGVVIANEFLDALPVHRVARRGAELLELYVVAADSGADALRGAGTEREAAGDPGGFAWQEGPPSTPALAERLASVGVELADGQEAEVCLGLDHWTSEVADLLVRGFVIVLDYGHPAAELYRSTRRRGTVMAYRDHVAYDDPLAEPGRRDVTAHVDFTTVAGGLEAGGLSVLGLTSQAEFLLGAGLEELFAARRGDPATDLAAYFELRGSILRLLDPRALGGFRVLVAGRGVAVEPTLRGLSRVRSSLS